MILLKDKILLRRYKHKVYLKKKEYSIIIEKAEKEGKKKVEIDDLFRQMYSECRDDEVKIEEIYTRGIIKKADKYHVEYPDIADETFWENTYGSHILTDHGKKTLNKQIKASFRENLKFWFGLLTIIKK